MKSRIKKAGLTLISAMIAGTLVSCSDSTVANNSIQDELVQSQSAEKGFLAGREFVKTGYTVIKIRYTDKKQLTSLNELGMDIWWVQPDFAIGQIPQDLLDRVKRTNLKMDMLSPKEGFSVLNNFDKGYHTYDSTVAELKSVAAKYPNLAKLQDFGDSWEKKKGTANRDLYIMQITGKGEGSKKPGIVFFGNHHAREIATVEISLKLISFLLDNYGKDADITNMVDNTEIWIAPMVNPDGHILAEKGSNWRKNTNTNKDISSNAKMGVDLNRNYGYKWNTGGSSADTGSETYHGKAPFSEPETQATRDFMKSHSNLKIMMSYHSFSNLILWPWGWSNSGSPDAAKFQTIGGKLGAMSGYKPEQSSQLYIASGITDDWSYGELKMLSFTTEMGSWSDGFDPPYSVVDRFWKENLPNAIYLIKLAAEQNTALGGNEDAAFGPDIITTRKTSAEQVKVFFQGKYPNEAGKVEYFLGTPGKPGTGTSVNVQKGTDQVDVNFVNKTNASTLYLRAQSPDGKWGTISAISLK